MEDYQKRMIEEYEQLKERADKLDRMINDYYFGELGFELNCPLELLESQYYTMCSYLKILEQRAKIEGVELQEKIYTVPIPVGNGIYQTVCMLGDGSLGLGSHRYQSLDKLREHNKNIPGGLTERVIKNSPIPWVWQFAKEITDEL